MGRASESPIAHLFVGPWKAWAEPCLQISPLIVLTGYLQAEETMLDSSQLCSAKLIFKLECM